MKPLYHSLMVASSYLVCDFKKSMSSLDSLSLLPKQPISATIHNYLVRNYTINGVAYHIVYWNGGVCNEGFSRVVRYPVKINPEKYLFHYILCFHQGRALRVPSGHCTSKLKASCRICTYGNKTTWPQFRWLMWIFAVESKFGKIYSNRGALFHIHIG